MWGLNTHDSLCRALANSVPCVVVSVAYRSVYPPCQCPSHPAPCSLACIPAACMRCIGSVPPA